MHLLLMFERKEFYYMKSILNFVNHSQRICIAQGRVDAIVISSNGAEAVVELFDGMTDHGFRMLYIYQKDQTPFSPNLGKGLYFRRGLYIKINAITTFVTITTTVMDVDPQGMGKHLGR